MTGLRNIFCLFMLLIACNGYSQVETTVIERLQEKQDSSGRPTVIFIHTDWCKYCTAMKNTTFKNEQVVDLLNENFYFVSLNGELQSDVKWKGTSYSFLPTGRNTGYHQLARKLGAVDGQLNFPVLVFLNEELEIIYQQVGFISAKGLIEILEKVSLFDEKD